MNRSRMPAAFAVSVSVCLCIGGALTAIAADVAPGASGARQLFLSAKIDSIRHSDDDKNVFDYLETRHLEQENAFGVIFASSEEVRRVTYASGLRRFDIVSASDRGRFDFGIPGAGKKAPPYPFGLKPGPALEPGTEGDYVYEELGTEELEGAPVRVILATVRPERATRMTRQWVKLWIEPESLEARRFEMRARENTLFLDYDIRLRIEVARGADRSWFPVRKELDFRYKLPFKAWRQGMTWSAYRDATFAPETERNARRRR